MDRLLTIDELLKELDKYNFKMLHVHHTWSPSHKDFNGSNYQKLQNGMRDYHLGLGWSDIGQHVTLFPDGKFMTGRDFGKTPASIKGYNTGAFAVEMLGNFDIGNDKLEVPQLDSIVKLAQYFDSKGKYIMFHREHASKTCPGTSIDKDWFMSLVKGKPKYIQILESKGANADQWSKFIEEMKDHPTGKWLPALIEKIGE